MSEGKNNSEQFNQEPGLESAIEGEDFAALERGLFDAMDRRSPRLAEIKESILCSGERKIAEIDQVREFEISEAGRQNLWLIVDFDDVLNHTTEENNELQESLSVETGIPIKRLKKIYEESKIETPEGKRVFRFLEFIKSVKAESGKSETIDKIVEKVDHRKYIDDAVKRAVIASRFGRNIGSGYSSPATVRVSILTHGDPKYQRERIKASGVEEIADEIIYTESSKREVVEILALKDYPAPKNKHGIKTMAPFTITFDDSPEQIKDLAKLKDPEYFVNVRFRHPQAKRFRFPHDTKKVVETEETVRNQSAVDLFTIALLGTTQEARDRFTIDPFDLAKDRKTRERLLSSWGYNLDDSTTGDANLKYQGPEDVWVLKKFIIGER